MYYSSVVSFDILLLLVSIIIFATPLIKYFVQSVPILCSQTKPWKLGGRDIVADSKGFILLVVLMPMQCEHCHKQLMKFQTIMETLPEIRIVVVAPHDENPRLIERYREEFSRVAVGLESLNERIWNTLSGAAHDHFIYDRCGRLANIIRHPKSDMSKFEHTLWALKLAISYAQCGWCQYDPPHLPVPQKPIVTACASFTHNGNTKMPCIKAVVQPQSNKTYRMSSNPRSNIPMRTNMIAPVRNSHRRTSDDYISPPSGVTPSPTTVENNQKTVVLTSNESQQQQQVSVPKQEPTRQQTQRKRLKFAQRKVITRPDNNISTASNWRASSGWTVSRTFPVRIDQSGSEQREQREQWKNEQQYQQQQNRRKQEQEHKKALEQLRIRQELQRMQQKQQHIKQEEQQRIWRQEEEQRRVQEQQRVQEMQRRQKERQHQEQQRFQQQQFERKIDEQRKLEEQKRVNELYTGLNGEEREHRLDRNGENNLRQLKTPLQQNIQDSAMTTRMTTFFNPAARTSSLYDVGDEEGDYDYSHAASETTVTPNEGTQIRGTKRPKDLPFLFENQVPCAAFTDEICMEQKKRIGADRMSKCCDKGIYLTDLCVPGRCTNATIELCCMQKFLQACFFFFYSKY
ncbi:Selenoprotein P N terminal region family protein [Acanthocheilonema viteae]